MVTTWNIFKYIHATHTQIYIEEYYNVSEHWFTCLGIIHNNNNANASTINFPIDLKFKFTIPTFFLGSNCLWIVFSIVTDTVTTSTRLIISSYYNDLVWRLGTMHICYRLHVVYDQYSVIVSGHDRTKLKTLRLVRHKFPRCFHHQLTTINELFEK